MFLSRAQNSQNTVVLELRYDTISQKQCGSKGCPNIILRRSSIAREVRVNPTYMKIGSLAMLFYNLRLLTLTVPPPSNLFSKQSVSKAHYFRSISTRDSNVTNYKRPTLFSSPTQQQFAMFMSRSFLLIVALATSLSSHSLVAAGKLNALGTAIFSPNPVTTTAPVPTDPVIASRLLEAQSIRDKMLEARQPVMTAAPKVQRWVG
jgi:hypothetical protein